MGRGFGESAAGQAGRRDQLRARGVDDFLFHPPKRNRYGQKTTVNTRALKILPRSLGPYSVAGNLVAAATLTTLNPFNGYPSGGHRCRQQRNQNIYQTNER
jgi:hypothetical protein